MLYLLFVHCSFFPTRVQDSLNVLPSTFATLVQSLTFWNRKVVKSISCTLCAATHVENYIPHEAAAGKLRRALYKHKVCNIIQR